MLHPVVDLGLLGVVEAVEGADEISGDAANPLEADAFLSFMSAAFGANVVDDAIVAAERVAIDRVVDGSVSDALLFHMADDLFEGIRVLGDIAIDFDIGDVSTGRQGMIRRFDVDLAEHADRIVDRDVEGIGVVISVGDALKLAIVLLVDADEAAGETFRRRCDDGEVEVVFLSGLLGLLVEFADDLETERLGGFAFAVVLADQGDETFGKTDEAKCQRTVADDGIDFIVPPQLVGIDPDTLSHKERHVLDFAMSLDLESVHELADDQVGGVIKLFEEEIEIAVGLDAESGEVDGSEGEVSPATGDLILRIPRVGHDAGAAPHIGDFGVIVAGFVEYLVERCVKEGEVGEEALSGADDGFAEEVVVGIAGVVVDAFLDLEDLDWEDRRFAIAQTGFRSLQEHMHDKPAFFGGVRSIVEGGEGDLGTGSGMHGVEIVDESFHGLVGLVFDFLPSEFDDGMLGFLPVDIGELVGEEIQSRIDGLVVLVSGFFSVGDQILEESLEVFLVAIGAQLIFGDADAVVAESLVVGFHDAWGHGIVEIRNGLSAVHVVLVRLDGDASQRGIGADGIGLANEAMSCGKAFFEELQAVDLAAGQSQRIEIEIVDVDIAVLVGKRDLRIDHLFEVIGLGRFASELEHGAHGGIGIDVGIFTLVVVFAGVLSGDAVDRGHQIGLGFTDAGTVGAIKDVFFRRFGIIMLDEDVLDDILAVFDRRRMGVVGEVAVDRGDDFVRQRTQRQRFASDLTRLGDGQKDLGAIERNDASVSLDDLCHDVCRAIGVCQFGYHLSVLRGGVKKNAR